jgi:hypothetical protein
MPGKLDEQIGNALKLFQETVSELCAAFLPVEAGGFQKVTSSTFV